MQAPAVTYQSKVDMVREVAKCLSTLLRGPTKAAMSRWRLHLRLPNQVPSSWHRGHRRNSLRGMSRLQQAAANLALELQFQSVLARAPFKVASLIFLEEAALKVEDQFY